MSYRVTLTAQTDDDRDVLLERLRARPLPDGEVLDDDEGVGLRLDNAESADAALTRAADILRGALDGAPIEHGGVSLSVGDWPG